MSRETHAIESIGLKAPTDPDRKFNPRLFHRGIADLQEIIHSLNASQYCNITTIDQDTQPTFKDHYNDEENTINPPSDTALKAVLKMIPTEWDCSVIIDANDNYDGYCGVSARLDCGDDIEIWIHVYIMGHYISKADFTVTDPTDPDRETIIERYDMSLPESPRYVLDTIRALESLIVACYANNISSAARAFDYAMNTSKPANQQSFGYGQDDPRMNQSHWAQARQTTRQTITNNISNARNDLAENGVPDLHADPLANIRYSSGNALVQGTKDDKEDAVMIYT